PEVAGTSDRLLSVSISPDHSIDMPPPWLLPFTLKCKRRPIIGGRAPADLIAACKRVLLQRPHFQLIVSPSWCDHRELLRPPRPAPPRPGRADNTPSPRGARAVQHNAHVNAALINGYGE